MNRSIRILGLAMAFILSFSLTAPQPAVAHISGGQSKVVGSYRIQFKTEPSIPTPGNEVSLLFSIQDLNGNNIENVNATVRLVRDESIVHEFPERRYPSGDFALNYVFLTEGDFMVVLVISESSGDVTVDFAVSVLSESIAFLAAYGILIGIATALGIPFLVRAFRAKTWFSARFRRSEK